MRTHHVVVPSWVLALALVLAAPAGAQQGRRSTPAGQPVVNEKATVLASGLDIQLAASRSQLSAGSTLGITATLTNLYRDSTVYLDQRGVVLLQPPELEGPMEYLRQRWAFFPTEKQAVGDSTPFLPPDSVVLALPPGGSVQVGWAAQPETGRRDRQAVWRMIWDEIRNEMRFLLFTPGEYRVSVAAKYWTSPARRPLEYKLASQSMPVTMTAPQFVILFGAAIGGLLAFIIFPKRRPATTAAEGDAAGTAGSGEDAPLAATLPATVTGPRRWLVRKVLRIGPASGAMLWSAIVTILLSRLSETQFLVRVTVSDFWGAIATGLVAQYVGAWWFERLLAGIQGQSAERAKEQARTAADIAKTQAAAQTEAAKAEMEKLEAARKQAAAKEELAKLETAGKAASTPGASLPAPVSASDVPSLPTARSGGAARKDGG